MQQTQKTHVRKINSAQRGKTRSKGNKRVIKRTVSLERREKNKVLTESRERSRMTKAAFLSATPSQFKYDEEGCWYEIESNITNEEHQKKVDKSIEEIERLESRTHVVLDDVSSFIS